MKKPAILIVEAVEPTRRSLRETCLSHGYEVLEAFDKPSSLRHFQEWKPALVIVGAVRDRPGEPLAGAEEVRRWNRRVPLIFITPNSSEDLAIAALRVGVTDYLRCPMSSEALLGSISRCLAAVMPRSSASPRDTTFPASIKASRLIGDSRAMRDINAYIGHVASTASTVLITGETGTGKELVARLIHTRSPRVGKPFVSINCAAIPENLLESELFGYERGAFTGAHAQREGALKLANEGTAFFDEIGDMSPEGQAKILKAIESKEIRRLGGRGSIPLDIRVIAATNQPLERSVTDGMFRKDLYFRLNVARIQLPPLRDRKEDIPLLVNHCIQELNRSFGREVEGLTEEAMEPLLRYEWPGNVRELKNLLEAVFVTRPPRRIALTDLPEQFRRRIGEAEGLPEDERDQLLSALFSTNWNKSKAAQKLHWSRMTLYRKMAKFHIGGLTHAGTDAPIPAVETTL